MTLFYLVRHGQTDLIGKVLCGNMPGVSLNQKGRESAARTAAYLSTQPPFAAVFSSPIERAYETASIIASQLKLQVQTVDFLREIHFGDLQGLQETALRSNPHWQQYLKRPAEIVFHNGESVKMVQERVTRGLEELTDRFPEETRLVCVAHSEVLRLAVAAAIGLPLDHFHHLSIDPASLSVLDWTKERKRLRLLNYSPTT